LLLPSPALKGETDVTGEAEGKIPKWMTKPLARDLLERARRCGQRR
jgi:hypothetical protein